MNQRAACIVALLQACGAPCARAGQEPAAGVPADERSVYLCSHATGWGLDDGTRLAPLGHSELALVYQVGRGRLVPGGDTCSLMATDAVNGWGSWQGFYDPQFRGVAEASRLGAPRPGRQPVFKVQYPFPGRYQITLSKGDDTFRIAVAVTPARAVAVIGTGVSFTTRVEGDDLSWRWQTKFENEPDDAWADVAGATGPQLDVVTGGFSMFCAQYRAIISSPRARTVSATATLANQRPPPVFTKDLPAEITAAEGDTVTLSVAATDASFYIWMRNGEPIHGDHARAGSLTTPPLTPADDGATYAAQAVHFAGNHQCTHHGVALSRTARLRVVPRRRTRRRAPRGAGTVRTCRDHEP